MRRLVSPWRSAKDVRVIVVFTVMTGMSLGRREHGGLLNTNVESIKKNTNYNTDIDAIAPVPYTIFYSAIHFLFCKYPLAIINPFSLPPEP